MLQLNLDIMEHYLFSYNKMENNMKRILFVTYCMFFFCSENIAQESKDSSKNILAPYSTGGNVQPLLGAAVSPEMKAQGTDNMHPIDSSNIPIVQPRMIDFSIDNPKR